MTKSQIERTHMDKTLYTAKDGDGWITAIHVELLADNQTAREIGNRKLWILMSVEPFKHDEVLERWESSDGIKAFNHLFCE